MVLPLFLLQLLSVLLQPAFFHGATSGWVWSSKENLWLSGFLIAQCPSCQSSNANQGNRHLLASAFLSGKWPKRQCIIYTSSVVPVAIKPHLHDTTCCHTGLTTGCIVYTNIQPVVKTGLTNGCIVYTAGCQYGCTTRFDKRLNEQWLFIQHGCHWRVYHCRI